MGKELIDIIGKRFGRLVVLERVEDAILPSGKHVPRMKCICDCGNEKIVRKCHLTSGATTSCGCLYNETRKGKLKHGGRYDRLYKVWLNMKNRCYDSRNRHYKSYGGRGITVCEEWKNNYEAFSNWCKNNGYIEDINPSGRNNITIDRINVNGNYEPSNCRFITNRENCLNKRNTMSDSERYKVCPICGKTFELKKRNEKQTCSAKCGHILWKNKKIMGLF